MADLKITDVPQGSSVATTDDFYIKTGNTFRRVPVSKLVTLLNTQGFYQKGLNGIPTTDLAEEQVVISPDGSGYVSSKTYSQISAAVEAGSAIHPEFRPDGNTYLRGMVLDILDSSALFAFLVPGTGPHISIFNVTDLTVTETRIPVSGQPCRAVCNTEEETAAKTAEVQGAAGDLFSLYDGATVYVYFTNAVSPGSTLNVNNTGEKYFDLAGATEIPAGTYAQVFYQEALGNWILVSGNAGGSGSGLTEEIKQALLACFANVAWATADGQDYYDALEDALCPPADLVSITAVYLQDRPIYETDDLDVIKTSDDLTVTAHYSDSTSVVLDDDDYTLSGTLTVGTSVITVSYGGKSTTINVTVTAAPTYVTSGLIHHWDGINNTGSGHSGDVTTWADLVGNAALTVTNQFAFWAENALGFSQSQADYVYADTLDNPSACTLEVCLESTGTLPSGVLTLNPAAGTGARNCREVALYADNTVGGVGQSGYTYDNPEAASSDIRTVAVDYTDLSVNHLYVNAVAAALSNKTHSYRYSGSKAISVGGFDVNAKFSGKIYSIRIYNRALTAAEIAQNHAVDVSRFGLE